MKLKAKNKAMSIMNSFVNDIFKKPSGWLTTTRGAPFKKSFKKNLKSLN
jgi:hypothetical protein